MSIHPLNLNQVGRCLRQSRRHSHFKFQVSSLILLLLICAANARAQQWIIDGQQTQTLNLNVSDPQAIHADGSRSMEAPLAFAPAVSSTSGLFRATVPWDEAEYDFFIFDADEERLDFSTQDALGLMFQNLYLNNRGMFDYVEGISINFEEHSLKGGWMSDSVLDNSYAILNRGYADVRYLMRTEGMTATHTIQAGDVLQIQNGLITAINP